MDAIAAVFFDAGGTLFEVCGSVGKIYSDIAQRYGAHTEPQILDTVFRREFIAKSAEGFPPSTPIDPRLTERQWWFELVQRVLAGSIAAESFEAYFAELYGFFCSASAWRLYPDVLESLKQLRARGLRLGVISNFDSRLRDILANLGIGLLFEQATISWEIGAAKPDAKIFQNALQAMGVRPQEALHVGDSIEEDVEGAKAAGLKPILLDRLGIHAQWGDGLRIRSLAELCRLFS
jgi:putative hydrolase of the HAD superfamily